MRVIFVEPNFPKNQREFVRALAEVGAEVIGMDTDLDFTFPKYNPNPEDLEMLHAMGHAVKQQGADLCLGFDGDGDRCGVVDETGREIFAEYLEFRGFRVATAADGLEALEKAFELHPDVILMDLSLPGIDGWEATRRLKQDDRTRDIPIIALTAHALAAAHDKAREVGCNAVVTKPCLPKDLEQEVRRQLEAKTT